MKKSELYLLLSIIAVVLTFVSGIGSIVSIVLLFLNNTERKRLLLEKQTDEILKELNQIRISNILSVVNILISVFFIIIGIVLLLFFGYLFLDGSLWHGVYNH